MALPSGVTTCTVTLNGGVDYTGDAAVVKYTIIAVDGADKPLSLVHASTGVAIFPHPEVRTVAAGTSSTIALPHTDQAGMIEATTGMPYAGWEYRVELVSQVQRDVQPTVRRLSIPASVGATADLDKLPTTSTHSVPEYQRFVRSVNGQSGDVTVSMASTLDELMPDMLDALEGAGLIAEGAGTLAGLADVTPTPAAKGDALAFDGSRWTPRRGPVIDVRDLGALGDGVTDDTAAIQSALDAAGTVVFPAGTYRVTEQLNLSSNTHLIGSGGATLTTAGNHRILYAAGKQNIRIEGLGFTGTLATGQPSLMDQIGVQANDTTGLAVEHCRFTNLHRAGVWLNATSGWRVANSTFTNYGYCAITANTGRDGEIVGNDLTGCGLYPVGLTYCYGVAISHSSTTAPAENVRVTGNRVRNQAWEALDTHGGIGITFRDNTIENCEAGIVATPVVGVAGSTPKNIHIVGNTVVAGATITPRQGISLSGSEVAGSDKATGIISGNIVRGHGNPDATGEYVASAITTTRSRGAIISGNIVSEPYGTGIKGRITEHLTIIDNLISGVVAESAVAYPDRAITLMDSNADVYVRGNVNVGATTAVFVQNGTPTLHGMHLNEWGPGGFVGVPSRGKGAPAATADPDSYPNGTTVQRATTGGGWPANGVLVTQKHGGDRTVQVLHSAGGSIMRQRGWDSTLSAWSAWYQFTGA